MKMRLRLGPFNWDVGKGENGVPAGHCLSAIIFSTYLRARAGEHFYSVVYNYLFRLRTQVGYGRGRREVS